ncbi:OmpA family protein [Moheibacter sediminis]|uniref:Ca-activated chloride channel family protein n=1 Tax=Moheibacter sediminis TaxID=1434700 RepID=A0A1W1Z9F8_9FLAO|nr:OmpA family protein [Moheibacter sediminis]SMC45060.1 Ca-activated chloride channel family protein [Moheibacter sediminis]
MRQFLFFILIFTSAIGFSQTKEIPHFQVDSGKPQLNFQSIEVNVVGKAADVHLYQSFTVQNKINGYYLYPVNLESSLYELTVYLSDKIISMDVRNMDNIRKQVLAENKKGKKVTLKHQDDSNFIKLNIPSIPENEEIKVVLKYTQNLAVNNESKNLEILSFINSAYELNLKEFEFKINLISPTPIDHAEINSHETVNKKVSEKYQTFSYTGNKWNNSIQLNYNSKGKEADAGMLVYEEKGCRYILGVVEPPKEIKPEQIAPREYVFVMDISGSMQGFPIETSKELVNRILHDLKPEEKFNILFFAGSSDFFAKESVYATPENIDLAIQMINDKRGTGKTKLAEALKKVYTYKPDKAYNRIVVLVTDGKLNEEKSLYFDLKQNLKDAQYFCFGIGYDIDRKTIQQISQISGTESVLIADQIDAKKEMDKFFNTIRTPLLRYIQVQSKNLNLSETYPSQFNGFLSSESSSFVSKECSGTRDPKLILTGINGEENYQEEFSLPNVDNNQDLKILKYLWGKEKIEFLLQEEERCGSRCINDGKYRNQIIKIGEELNIATPYTSFIEESYVNNNNNRGRKYSLYENPNNQVIFQNDYDSDFDKVPNTIDECPYDRGLISRKGCPKTKQEKITTEINRMLEGIEFDFDSFLIKSEFYEKLNTAASIISSQSEQVYVVEGHTDAAGTPQYNQNLSMSRAKAVSDYLVQKGVKESQMKLIGKGDTELKHPECRPQEVCDDQKNFENRRVIFKTLN